MIIFNRVDLSVTSNTVQTGFWLPPCLLLFLLQTKLGSSFFSRRGECDDRVTTGTFPVLSCRPKTLPKLTALAPNFLSSFRCPLLGALQTDDLSLPCYRPMTCLFPVVCAELSRACPFWFVLFPSLFPCFLVQSPSVLNCLLSPLRS